ncbi:MAG: cbb3-type cytochrome c oxidase subunit I [Dehalococcoidia bacterium]
MRVFSLGVVRGLLAGLVGAGLGAGLTMLVRMAMGLPAWNAGPVTAVAILLGVVAWMVGLGAFRYWLKWAIGSQEAEEDPGGNGQSLDVPRWTRYFSFDTNHKVIGVQYMLTAFLFLLIGGLLALLMRLQLATSGATFLSLGTYNTVMSLHGIIMIAVILIGIAGPINYLLPLMIGARDMAFPRLNAFSFWLVPPAGILLILSLFVGGFDTGWTAYPPLSTMAPLGMQFMLLAVYLVGLSSILGGINFLTTIIKSRAPGMSLFRMPIFVWAVLATAALQVTVTQFIAMSFVMVLLERLLGMGFFTPAMGGNVMLFEHMFWFYSHPAVYIFALPGLGIISEIIPVFSRKPLFGYKWVAFSSIAIAVLGLIVWGHHLYVAGMADVLVVPFMVTTVLIAVPTGIKMFAWLSTMWRGKLQLATPLLFALTAIAVFLVGGLTGVVNAIVPADLLVHDSYWVVGHFHHTLFGAFVFPMMAAFYYWFPKVTGRHLSERWGKLHWGLMSGGFFITYLPMFWLGLNGMRRRIGDYDPSLGLEPMNLVVTIGGFIIAVGLLVFVYNLVVSAWRGVPAVANPWRARTLEWQVSSPPPEENFAQVPQVVGFPYDYGALGSVHALLGTAGGSPGRPGET